MKMGMFLRARLWYGKRDEFHPTPRQIADNLDTFNKAGDAFLSAAELIISNGAMTVKTVETIRRGNDFFEKAWKGVKKDIDLKKLLTDLRENLEICAN